MVLGHQVISLGVFMCCKALDQKDGRWEIVQDVVSLEPSEVWVFCFSN